MKVPEFDMKAPEFNKKHLKKAEEQSGSRNIVCIIIEMEIRVPKFRKISWFK